jgi:putative ABC transport system permease protein
MISEWISRFRFFLRRDLLARRRSNELDEELQFHVEQATAANMAQGMTPEEARRNALIEFGGVEQAREWCQEQEPGWWIDMLLQDVRYALRGFRRSPIFAITVIATLSLGIGATTAVFSVVDPILFRPLPYANPVQLVSVGFTIPDKPRPWLISTARSKPLMACADGHVSIKRSAILLPTWSRASMTLAAKMKRLRMIASV